ncbi:MAG: hypothetical protein WHV66_10125 [Anaerolineales bacterium]
MTSVRAIRVAGLLPHAPPDTEYQEEFFHLLSQLSPQERQEILELLRFKAERKSAPTVKPLSRKVKPPAQAVLNDK